jgi:hypothetical protein
MKDELSIIGFSSLFSLTGSFSIRGDILLFGSASFAMTGNASVEGQAFLDALATWSIGGSASISGGVQQRDYSVERQHLADFSDSITALPPGIEVDEIDGSRIIEGRGGINVVHVAKGISLSGSERLVLRGGERDVFILNVDGDISLAGSAKIDVEGGVKAESVVINNVNAGGDIMVTGNARVSGTFVAMHRGIFIAGNVRIRGTIVIGLQIMFLGNGGVFDPGAFCVLPQPSGSPAPSPTASPGPSPSATPGPSPTATPSPTPEPSPLPCSGPICGGGPIGV